MPDRSIVLVNKYNLFLQTMNLFIFFDKMVQNPNSWIFVYKCIRVRYLLFSFPSSPPRCFISQATTVDVEGIYGLKRMRKKKMSRNAVLWLQEADTSYPFGGDKDGGGTDTPAWGAIGDMPRFGRLLMPSFASYESIFPE